MYSNDCCEISVTCILVFRIMKDIIVRMALLGTTYIKCRAIQY